MKKRILSALIPIAFAVVIAVILIIWDPADMLRIRQVGRAEGTYVAEETYFDELGFSFESISVSGEEVTVVTSASSNKTLNAALSVSGNRTLITFDYDGGTCTLFCTRKSNDFKLIGTTVCDYLLCSVHVISENKETVIGDFKAEKIKI